MRELRDISIERDLAERLTMARRRKGIMVSFVAHKTGVTSACVTMWESGDNFPHSFTRWKAWAEAVMEELTIRLEA